MSKPRRSESRPTCRASSKTSTSPRTSTSTAGQVLYRLDPRQFQIALDNAKANLAQTALMHRGDEAGLSAHAERHRRPAGAGRTRSDEVRQRRDAAAQPHHLPGCLRSGEGTLRQRQEQTRIAARSRRRCSSPSWAAIPTSTSRSIRNICRPRRRSTRRSASSIDTVVKAPFAGIVTDVPSIAPGKYLAASTTAFYPGRHRSRLDRGQAEGNRADLCAARPAGHGDGRYLSGSAMARHGRKRQPGGGAGIFAAAGAEHQRQLGEGRAARADARARRYQRQIAAAAARRDERRGRRRHRPRARLPAFLVIAVLARRRHGFGANIGDRRQSRGDHRSA